MKRWRSVKMMILALVALFIPALAMPALCCVNDLAPSSSRHVLMQSQLCQHETTSLAMQCAAHKARSQCCCKPAPTQPKPTSPDLNLPTAGTRSAIAQAEQSRAVFGPQYLTTILISAPQVLSPLPQTSERNFEIISPLSSLDKSPPAPGRAPPVL